MVSAGVFWVGIKGKSNDIVDTTGVQIPDENASYDNINYYLIDLYDTMYLRVIAMTTNLYYFELL